MSKTTWFFLFVIAFLVLACVYFAVPSFKTTINDSILTPGSVAVGGALQGLYASSFWQTYVIPNQFIIGGVSGGLIVALFMWLVRPKLPTIRHKAPTTAPPLSRPSSAPTYPSLPTSNPTPAIPPSAPAPSSEPTKSEEAS